MCTLVHVPPSTSLLQTQICYKNGSFQVNDVSECMENHFIATYTKNDPIVQDKIRQLFEAFERITQLELELEEFKSKFGAWFKDLATDV